MMIIRPFVLFLCLQAFGSAFLSGKPVSLDDLTLSPSPDEREVRAYISSLGSIVNQETERMVTVARAGGRASMDPAFAQALVAKIAATPNAHVGLLCKTATGAPAIFRGMLLEAITSRNDYEAAQKGVILEYLPKLPALIVVVEKQNWFDGAEAAIAAGWNEAKKDAKDGVLRGRGFRYAKIAARHGVTDAVVAIARMASEGRDRGDTFAEAADVLEVLVPAHEERGAALANAVLKNRKKLVFDRQSATYAFSL